MASAQVTRANWLGNTPVDAWGESDNWSAGTPGASDTAVLTGAGSAQTKTIVLYSPVTVDTLTMNGSTAADGNTLYLNGNAFTATTVNLSAGTITGNSGGGTGTLNVGTLNMTGGAITGVTVNIDPNNGVLNLNNVTLGGTITGGQGAPDQFTPAPVVIDVQGGTVSLTSTNTFLGSTAVESGATLSVANAGGLSSGNSS